MFVFKNRSDPELSEIQISNDSRFVYRTRTRTVGWHQSKQHSWKSLQGATANAPPKNDGQYQEE